MSNISLHRREWLGAPSLRAGAIASLVLLLIGFVSIAWTPYPTDAVDVGGAMQNFSVAHWLGTDHLGRDIASLVMKGMLTSFVVAFVAVAMGAIVGVPLGLAAMWGGAADWAVQRVSGFLVVFPAIIVAIILATLAGPDAINVMVAVGLFNVPVFAKLTRDTVTSLGARDYASAARLAGMSGIDIARRHILPTLVGLILIQAILQLAVGILAEASLSFVGLGAQPPATSLGLMLRDAQTYATLRPSMVLIPGVVIVLLVVSLNLAADGLRQTGGKHGAA